MATRPSLSQPTGRPGGRGVSRRTASFLTGCSQETVSISSAISPKVESMTTNPTTEVTSVKPERQPGGRLLAPDDAPNILELLSASLRFAGFDVATAKDGGEAL